MLEYQDHMLKEQEANSIPHYYQPILVAQMRQRSLYLSFRLSESAFSDVLSYLQLIADGDRRTFSLGEMALSVGDEVLMHWKDANSELIQPKLITRRCDEVFDAPKKYTLKLLKGRRTTSSLMSGSQS